MAKKGEKKKEAKASKARKITIRRRIITSFAVLGAILMVFTFITLNELGKISRINTYINSTINPTKVHLQSLNEMVNRSSIYLQIYMVFENNNQKVEGDYKQKRALIWSKDIQNLYDTLRVYERKWQNMEMKLKYLNLQTSLKKLENSQLLVEDVIAKKSDNIYNLENLENLEKAQNEDLSSPQANSREDAFSKRVLPLITQVRNEIIELQSIQNQELDQQHAEINRLWSGYSSYWE